MTATELAAGVETLEGLALHASEVPASESTVAEWLNGLNLASAGTADSAQQPQGETAIRIAIGEQGLEGVLYDNNMARQFIVQLVLRQVSK